jgi:hypothetical protein
MNFTRASESPDAYHFWTGVGTIAGTLRRRVWLDMRHFQWTPNFCIILVGPPGVANKSTTIRIGSSLLAQVDGIHFGPQSMTWQSLIQTLEQSNISTQAVLNSFKRSLQSPVRYQNWERSSKWRTQLLSTSARRQHDRASSLLHRTMSAVEGGPAAFRPALGSRNQPRGDLAGSTARLLRIRRLTSTGFAHRIERRDAVGLWKEPETSLQW